jgi:hypothetical protein
MWMNAGVVQQIEHVEVKRYWDPKPITYPVLHIERYDHRSEYLDGKRIEVPDIKRVKLSRVDRVTVLPGLTAADLRSQLYGEAVVDGEVRESGTF